MRISSTGVSKNYPRAGKSGDVLAAVRPLDLDLKVGDLTVLTGRSGSGKSTLLSMLAGMLTPTSGVVSVDETDMYSLDERARSRLRNARIGLVPQGHTALRSLTVLENVLLPAVLYSRQPPPLQRAEELLEAVGIASLAPARPNELSGGELRRMAVARSLLMSPGAVLADEPTAGLDDESTADVLRLLRETADDGAAVLVVTHEDEAMRFADRTLTMEAGRLRPRDRKTETQG